MFRTVLAVAATAALMGAAAPAAMADGYELVVGKSPADAAGTVTATATFAVQNSLGQTSVKTKDIVDCGADCAESVEQYDPCALSRCELAWPVVELRAQAAEGFVLTGWRGCVLPARGRGCVVDTRTITGDVEVVAGFEDVQAPAVQPIGPDPGAAVNGRTTLAAGAADNWGVAQVEFLAGGRSLGVDADPRDGWTLDVDTTALPEGVLALQVVATDLAGNRATGDWSIVVDRSAAVTLAGGTPGGFVRSPPAVPFTGPADAAAVTCRTVRAGAPAPAFSACRSPYGPVTSGDGAYTVEVAVTDAIGNRGAASHAFTLDTTAPAGAITAGPAEGERLRRSDGAFAFSVSDASPVEVTCGLDGALAPCGGTSGFAGLPDGSHRFVLRIADAAGNVTELARSFSIDVPDAVPPAITPVLPKVQAAPEVLRGPLLLVRRAQAVLDEAAGAAPDPAARRL